MLLVRGIQPQAMDISLPKLFNGIAMVYFSPPKSYTLVGKSVSQPLAAFDLCMWRTSYGIGDTRISKQMVSAMGKGSSSIAVFNRRFPYVCS